MKSLRTSILILFLVTLTSATNLPATPDQTSWDQLKASFLNFANDQVKSFSSTTKDQLSTIITDQLPLLRDGASTIVTEQISIIKKTTYAVFKQQIPRFCYTGLAFTTGVIGLCVSRDGFKRLCDEWETEKSKKAGTTELSVGLGTTLASIIIINRLWK